MIRFVIALLGLAAIATHVRRRYMAEGRTSLHGSESEFHTRDWISVGQDLSFVLLALGAAAGAVAAIIQVGPMFKAGMLAVVAAGGVWGVCEAAKRFR